MVEPTINRAIIHQRSDFMRAIAGQLPMRNRAVGPPLCDAQHAFRHDFDQR
jgi:hypothetical protein